MTVLQGVLADRDAWSAVGECPIEKTMALVGTKSAMLIMREAYYGTTRFDDFARRVGITKAATSTRLSELVEAGLLAKQPYREPGQRSRDEYVLTEAGTDFMPVVWAMFEWGRTHLNDTGLRLTHLGCGAEATVEIRCADGHDVPPDELAVGLARNQLTPCLGVGSAGPAVVARRCRPTSVQVATRRSSQPLWCGRVLHLRVISPEDLRDDVMTVLRDKPGVANMLLYTVTLLWSPGVTRSPPNIARESANDVVDRLKELGVKERGAITLDVVDTVMSTRAYRAEEDADGDPADAVVWDELIARTREESTLDFTFVVFLMPGMFDCRGRRRDRLDRSPSSVPWWWARSSARWQRLPLAWCNAGGTWPVARRWPCSSDFPLRWLVTAIGDARPAKLLGWIEHRQHPTAHARWTSSFRSARCRLSLLFSRARRGCCPSSPRNPRHLSAYSSRSRPCLRPASP